MAWTKVDDGWWSHPKLRRAGRAARGLFCDLLAYSADKGSDGFVPADMLDLVGASPADPDLKALLKVGMLHRRTDECRCMATRAWSWPADRGYLIHDYLDYNPSKAETTVARAQKAELRDPALRAELRARDFGRCRYCAVKVGKPSDRRSPFAETLDHVDPAVAAGADNLVIACRACNGAKKDRTPTQAQMLLLTVADVRAKHYAELGVPDPDQTQDQTQDLGPITGLQADGPGRVRDGSGRVGRRSQIGPPDTIRGSEHPNPYLRAGHADPALEPPPPQPDPPPRSPPAKPNRRSQRARTKGRRR